MRTDMVAVPGTTLAVDVRGEGDPLLLIHGGGEDAAMLGPQAQSLAEAGFEVFTYDRRGTGRSGRQGWPGGGARQHADDAAALIDHLGLGRTTLVGVSSGAVVALAVLALHPTSLARVIAWEPPAMGVVPGGRLAGRALMVPARRHLARHPGDYPGAQARLLRVILARAVTVDDPDLAATRANAEPMIRDEPDITAFPLRRYHLAAADVTIAVGSSTVVPIKIAARRLASWTGTPLVRLDAHHEIYLTDPGVLTQLVGEAGSAGGQQFGGVG